MTTWPDRDLLHAAAAIVEIDQAQPGLLDEFIADAWERIRNEAEDLEHCPIGAPIYVGRLGGKLPRWFRHETERVYQILVEDEADAERRLAARGNSLLDYFSSRL